MREHLFSLYRFIHVTIKAGILLGLCCMDTLQAQQYGFLNFTTDNGLAQSQVTGMCQDKLGYLWFSTFGGVSRYDGLEYRNFATNNGLVNNQVQSVFCDRLGNIWFGCMGSYSQYKNGKFSSYTFSSDLSQSNIVALNQFPKSSALWLLFDNASLVEVNGNQHRLYTISDTAITEARNFCIVGEKILIATNKGIVQFNKTSKSFETIEAFGRKNYSFIAVSNSQIVLSTFDDGIFFYDLNHKLLKHISAIDGLIDDSVRHLFIDSEGNVWVSTISGVSYISTSYSVTNFNTSNGLVNNNIRFTAQDNEGNIWFGTDGKGILKFTGKSVMNYTVADGLSGDLVMSVLQTGKNEFWFATYGNGVTHFDGKKYIHYTDLVSDIVWTLAQDREGKIWMGTSNGLICYDGKKFTTYSEADGLLSGRVTSLYADKKGRLWIGNRVGLNYFYEGKIYTVSNAGINGGNIRCIIPDKDGTLWLGSRAGLYQFNGKKAKLFKYNYSNEDNTVYCLRFDENNTLWVGTHEGLFRFKNEVFSRVDFEGDLISGNVNFIMPDKTKLWFGTNNGIYELNLAFLYASDSVVVRSFGRNEGLKGRETNMNAVYQDWQDNLWFGTDGGLVKIGKQRFSIDTKIKPFVHINDVKIFFEIPQWNKLSNQKPNEFGFPNTARVKYNQNHFTFYFTGISHTQPQKLRYKFMLEGFDQDWLPITETRYVTYSSLPPGTYKFKVMAQNANGLWSERPAVFNFTIVAPFWRTWWFYSLCVLFVALIIYALWQFRLNQIKRKNETTQLYYKSKLLSLEQQSLNASMNRHFIFNSLNSIQYYINKQDKLEANRYLTNFAKLIRKNLDSSISSDLIPLSEELERIKLYLSLENMRFKDRFEYSVEIDPSLSPEGIFIPPMLFQPYLENSIWHGILPKEDYLGHIYIRIFPKSTDNQLVIIEIEDDGIGLSTSLANKSETGSTHVSRGIEITSGRLNLLKKVTNQDLEIIGPLDITDPSGKTTGTLVRLVISVKIPPKAQNSSEIIHEN